MRRCRNTTSLSSAATPDEELSPTHLWDAAPVCRLLTRGCGEYRQPLPRRTSWRLLATNYCCRTKLQACFCGSWKRRDGRSADFLTKFAVSSYIHIHPPIGGGPQLSKLCTYRVYLYLILVRTCGCVKNRPTKCLMSFVCALSRFTPSTKDLQYERKETLINYIRVWS